MDLLFVILRMLLGPDCISAERLEPVMVCADGRTLSVRTLSAEYWQLGFAMSWQNLRHVFRRPFVDTSQIGDASASPRQCRAYSSQEDAALLLRRNLRS